MVSGGPESLLGLLEKGLVSGPTVLAGDASGAGSARIVTDGLRRRELNIGRMRDNVSHTLAASEETRQGRVRSDLLPFPGAEHQTVASYQGIRSVAASSGASFADTVGGTEPSYLPFAAIDGDPATSWRSDPYGDAPGQWLEVVLDTPRRVDDVTVDFGDDLRAGLPVRLVRIATDQGAVDRELPDTPGPHRLSTLPGLTTTVRVTVLALRENYFGGAVALRELSDPRRDRTARAPRAHGRHRRPATGLRVRPRAGRPRRVFRQRRRSLRPVPGAGGGGAARHRPVLQHAGQRRVRPAVDRAAAAGCHAAGGGAGAGERVVGADRGRRGRWPRRGRR